MTKSIPFRIFIVIVLIVFGVIYLYPTLRYEQLSKKEMRQIEQLAELTGMPLSTLATDIYLDEIDLKGQVEKSDLDEATKIAASEKIDYLRGPFRDQITYHRKKAIKRGLDLQGGMRMVMEVDLVELVEKAAKGKDGRIEPILEELKQQASTSDINVLESLELLCREKGISMATYWGEPGQSDESVRKDLREAADDAIDRSLEILRNRVDQFGVSEPTIAKMGTRRISIELPGVKDPSRARELIGRTALLEFKLVAKPERTQEVLLKIDNVVKANMGIDTTTIADSTLADNALAKTKSDSAAADTSGVVKAEDLFEEAGEMGLEEGAPDSAAMENPFLSLLVGGAQNILVPAKNKTDVNRIIYSLDVQKSIPNDLEFRWANAAEELPGAPEPMWTLYLVKKDAEQTGATLADARSTIGSGYEPDQAGKPIVEMEMTRAGARTFARVTGANIGERLAIVLDDKVHSAPSIRSRIAGGSAVITGMRDMDEARDLAIVLRAGALPAPVKVIEERTVGPSLGTDSVRKGGVSLLLSFLLVTLFMLWYYRLSGGLADFAMVLNIFLLMGILAIFQFTLTMPGIAGIILTIGLAVDANVLIFERIREELRLGKTVRAAIDTGFARAVVTIIDANVTTAIAGVVLLIYGTGPIKGFALTLTVGICVNIFAAVVITRLVYDILTERFHIKRLSV
ncbi:protein translocase subunit SecD [bacterium]|nr:protein translocase subunit SecD [bacterium]